MSLAAGSATSGKTGALAMQLNTTGSTIYVPHGGFNPGISTGRSIIGLVNNTSFSSNEYVGVTTSGFSLSCPLILGLHNANWFAKVLGYVAGDNDGSNYHLLTNFPDDAGSSPVVYARCKFGTMRQTITASDGPGSVIGMSFSGLCLDPESGSVAALAAPSAGPLSNSGILGYAETNPVVGGNTLDGWSQIDITVNVTLVRVPGVLPGTNTAYPHLGKGALATNLSGSVTITQIRNAQYTVSENQLILNFGSTGAGIAESLSLMPMGGSKPTGLGLNMVQQQFALKSISGESPITWTDL